MPKSVHKNLPNQYIKCQNLFTKIYHSIRSTGTIYMHILHIMP